MSKVAVVYWSGTGNTQTMATFVAEGAKKVGGFVDIFTSSDFHKSLVDDYDCFAFGCPSMGDEVLEEMEFQPMWDNVKDLLANRPIVLFGSYGWGDGEWMRNWAEEVTVVETYICNGTPDADAEATCEALGEILIHGK